MNSFSNPSRRSASVLIAALVAGAGASRAQPVVSSLEVIAPFGLGTSSVAGLNNSGQVLVTADGNGWKPIVWTSGGFTEITDTLAGGGGSVNVSGINDAGQVAGTVNNGAQAFVWSAGTMSEISNPIGAGQMFPSAINNSGAVVSEVFSGESTFLVKSSGGGSVTLQADESTYPTVQAINDAGQSVGSAYDSGSGLTRATRWDAAGNASVITVPNMDGNAYAQSINNSGVVAGSFTNLVFGFIEVETAFVWDGVTAISLGSLLASEMQSSVAYDVNDFGQVVGHAYGGFLYTDGDLYDLDELAADLMGEEGVTSGFLSLNQAYHINNLGQIVGTGTYYDFETDSTHDMGFLLSLANVPEPSATAALAGLAALAVVALRRRRRA
jgi:hypothetical protein